MNIFKSIGLAFYLLATLPLTKATDIQGYIIKPTGDTVTGVVDVPLTKEKNKDIMFADMWSLIKFSDGSGKSKKMKAGDINGFGFLYKGNWYHYEMIDLQKNYKQKAPKLLAKMVNDFRFFVLRVQDGPLPVYREYWRSETETKRETGGRTITMYNQEVNVELWVKKEGTFLEIAPTTLGGRKKLKKFLTDYLKLEDSFLTTVDDKAKFEDAEEVLMKYNEWKKMNTVQ